MISDRIVVGIKDRQLSERMKLDAELTLGKATATAHQSEVIKEQAAVLHGYCEEKV